MNRQLCLLLASYIFNLNCFSQNNSSDTTINLFFKTNSFTLDTQQCNSIKIFLISYPNITQIDGYADTFGTIKYNDSLSRKRALGIFNFIKNNGESIDISIVKYYGESEALSDAWMNRRAVIHAHKEQMQETETTKIPNIPDTISVIDLENLYFLPDKAVLSQESVPYIQELAKQLKSFAVGKFEIVGHVNYQSRFDSTHLGDLYNLSTQRAKAVYGYLLEFGIPAARMVYRGVGNSQPIFISPKNDEEKRKNMRVQVIITNR